MGIDKEATDIWKFGRKRPDLTLDESLAAPMPTLTEDETAERQRLLTEHREEFIEQVAPIVLSIARRALDRRGTV